MEKQFFHLSPVEVVEVTKQNLEEVAEWCGGQVAETASRRKEGRMDKYVWVPTPKGNGISWAFPGMYVTKRIVVTQKGEFQATWAVFRRDYFLKNYFEDSDKAMRMTWAKSDGVKIDPKPVQAPVINIHVSNSDNFTETAETVKQALLDAGLNNTVAAGQTYLQGRANSTQAALPPSGGMSYLAGRSNEDLKG